MTNTEPTPASVPVSDGSESVSNAGLDVPEGYVPFTSRYGYRTHLDGLGRIFFSCRHTHDDNDAAGWSHCERDPRFRCACPGSPGHPRCCQRASQEDRLCDACRDWCVAIDEASVYHRFVDLYGVAAR